MSLSERCVSVGMSRFAVLPREFALLAAERTKRGRPIGYPDAQIAAIALSMGCTLATLSAKDFDGIEGLSVADLAIL